MKIRSNSHQNLVMESKKKIQKHIYIFFNNSQKKKKKIKIPLNQKKKKKKKGGKESRKD